MEVKMVKRRFVSLPVGEDGQLMPSCRFYTERGTRTLPVNCKSVRKSSLHRRNVFLKSWKSFVTEVGSEFRIPNVQFSSSFTVQF